LGPLTVLGTVTQKGSNRASRTEESDQVITHLIPAMATSFGLREVVIEDDLG
jgi:hypothetical protein